MTWFWPLTELTPLVRLIQVPATRSVFCCKVQLVEVLRLPCHDEHAGGGRIIFFESFDPEVAEEDAHVRRLVSPVVGGMVVTREAEGWS